MLISNGAGDPHIIGIGQRRKKKNNDILIGYKASEMFSRSPLFSLENSKIFFDSKLKFAANYFAQLSNPRLNNEIHDCLCAVLPMRVRQLFQIINSHYKYKQGRVSCVLRLRQISGLFMKTPNRGLIGAQRYSNYRIKYMSFVAL